MQHGKPRNTWTWMRWRPVISTSTRSPSSWMVSTSMRSWWRYQVAVKSSFKSFRETKERTCRATWWGTWQWWSAWKRSKWRFPSSWQVGTFWHVPGCRSGHTCKWRACVVASWIMTRWAWHSWGCLVEITDPIQRISIVMAEKKLSMRMSRQRMTATMRTRPMMIGFGDDYGYNDEECYYEDAEEPLPSDVESAVDQTEEAYVNYLESRRRMRDLALSRGFYPIVALGPEVGQQGYGRKGDGKGKGKGKSKGGKSKGKGKSKSYTRSFQNRRPMSGLRRTGGASTTASTSSTSSGSEIRSTLSGSTAQHGPRFKRYRMQSSGVKEVPEEQVAMVTEETVTEETYKLEECFFQESITVRPSLTQELRGR